MLVVSASGSGPTRRRTVDYPQGASCQTHQARRTRGTVRPPTGLMDAARGRGRTDPNPEQLVRP